jgi:hypothetical protein
MEMPRPKPSTGDVRGLVLDKEPAAAPPGGPPDAGVQEGLPDPFAARARLRIGRQYLGCIAVLQQKACLLAPAGPDHRECL